MKRKIKEIIKSLSSFLISFLLLFVFSAILLINILSKISQFIDLPSYSFLIAVGVSFTGSLVITFLSGHSFKREHLIIWFIQEHFPGFIGTVLIINLLVVSIHKDLIMTNEKAIDLLSVEWAIFGITIGVFAIWHALVFNKVYSEPAERENKGETVSFENELEKLCRLYEMKELHYSYVNSYDPVLFIVLNLLVLVAATTCCFLVEKYTIVDETIVVFSAYCCTNSLITVVLDIVLNLSRRRNALLSKTKVNPAEVNDSRDLLIAMTFLNVMDEMDKKTSLIRFKTDNEELNAFFVKSHKLLLDYRKDAKSVIENKKDILVLSDYLLSLKVKKEKRQRKPRGVSDDRSENP